MKQLTILSLIFFTSFSITAQDIIIKTDKSEIKAKVLEIEEANVKYKLFDFQDGPTYNIKKSEIFMIIYSNGERESFETTVSAPITGSSNPTPANNTQQQRVSQGTVISKISETKTADNIEEENVIYRPLKLLFYSGGVDGSSYGTTYSASAYLVELTYEAPLIKNFLNYGINGLYTSISSNTSAEYGVANGDAYGYGLGAYLSGYISINRLSGRLDKQNQGLFPFVRAGSIYTTTVYNASSSVNYGEYGYETGDMEVNAYGFDYRIGLDYLFSESLGVTFITDFSAFGGGINFQF